MSNEPTGIDEARLNVFRFKPRIAIEDRFTAVSCGQHPKICSTASRRPLRIGFPPNILGFTVIVLKAFPDPLIHPIFLPSASMRYSSTTRYSVRLRDTSGRSWENAAAGYPDELAHVDLLPCPISQN